MKKFFLIMVMMFTMSIHSFADNSETTSSDNIERYEFKINHRRLACVLNLSIDQLEMADDVMSEFERDMLFASTCEIGESRDNVVSNLVKKNVKYMGYILNAEQHRKYLTLLNLTLKNRGFNVEI